MTPRDVTPTNPNKPAVVRITSFTYFPIPCAQSTISVVRVQDERIKFNQPVIFVAPYNFDVDVWPINLTALTPILAESL
jgi:hypothetical protein